MGRLYVVPTPVGNLEDMTFRAIRILKEADLILAEDTRTSGILLKHFEIKNAMQSYHKFNEHKTVEGIINRLKAGETIALVSDAGTPGISDPGFLVVRECVKNDIEVQCLPGATAFVPALVASGLPDERFCFEGFLPQKKGRMTRLNGLVEETRTMIFYESPYRLVKTLTQFAEIFGPERQVSVCREISKIHEESVRGTLQEVIAHFTATEREERLSLYWQEKKIEVINSKQIKTMKKVVLFSLCAAAVLASCNNAGQNKDALKLQNDSLMIELSNRDAELDEIMGAFNEIQEGFREINEAENRVDLTGDAIENKSSADKIKEDIRFISEKLKSNREQIAKLEEQLKNSNYQSAQLKKAIKNLTAQLEEKQRQIETLQAELASKNIRIAELDEAVSDLNKNVDQLTAENEAKTKTVAAQDKALNTAWYVFGTKSELKDQKILNRGDVLKDNEFNKDYFTEIDIRKDKEIKLYSKRATLLTTHPAGSYELAKDDKGQLTLKITNPNQFWSVSRYLVIQVR